MLKILLKRRKIAHQEQFVLFSAIFSYLMLDFYVKTMIRFSLRDKRLFEITEVEITKIDYMFILPCQMVYGNTHLKINDVKNLLTWWSLKNLLTWWSLKNLLTWWSLKNLLTWQPASSVCM